MEIVIEFIKNKNFKYIRLLGMVYFRMVCTRPEQIYEVLEPYYADYRKVSFRDHSGQFTVTHVDQLVDELLREERFCDVMLPRIPKRWVLEDEDKLNKGGRASALEQDLSSSSDGEENNDYSWVKDEKEEQ